MAISKDWIVVKDWVFSTRIDSLYYKHITCAGDSLGFLQASKDLRCAVCGVPFDEYFAGLEFCFERQLRLSDRPAL